MRRGLLSSRFGTVTVSTPSVNDASIRSGATFGPNVRARKNRPCHRSMRWNCSVASRWSPRRSPAIWSCPLSNVTVTSSRERPGRSIRTTYASSISDTSVTGVQTCDGVLVASAVVVGSRNRSKRRSTSRCNRLIPVAGAYGMRLFMTLPPIG